MPEGVNGKNEVPHRQSEQVDEHPKHVNNFPCSNQDENGGETEHSDEEHERNGLLECLGRCDDDADDEGIGKGNGDWKDDRSEEIHEHDELHAEAERSAQISNQDKLHEVVNRGVDPSTTLGEQDGEGIGDDGSAASLGQEHHLPVRERSK